MRSKLNDFLAAQARQPPLAGATTVERLLEREPDRMWEERWQREYQVNLVRWAVGQIQRNFKPQTWQAFWRTAIEGQPAEAVAGDLGLSLNALYIARSRVTSRLRQMLQSIEEDATFYGGMHD